MGRATAQMPEICENGVFWVISGGILAENTIAKFVKVTFGRFPLHKLQRTAQNSRNWQNRHTKDVGNRRFGSFSSSLLRRSTLLLHVLLMLLLSCNFHVLCCRVECTVPQLCTGAILRVLLRDILRKMFTGNFIVELCCDYGSKRIAQMSEYYEIVMFGLGICPAPIWHQPRTRSPTTAPICISLAISR